MLYNEFIEGTGCKDNEHNYNVYKELEIIYMNTDCTKQHIYDMGKKLVDNSKSKEQLALEAEIKEEIESHKRVIENYKKDIEWKQTCIEEWSDDKEWVKQLKSEVKYYKEQIKIQRNRIKELRWVLS